MLQSAKYPKICIDRVLRGPPHFYTKLMIIEELNRKEEVLDTGLTWVSRIIGLTWLPVHQAAYHLVMHDIVV